MISQQVEAFKAMLHATWVAQYPWLESSVRAIIDFLTGPLTGFRTRSYWPELVAAVLIAVAVFVLRDRKAGQGPRTFLNYLLPRDSFINRSTWVDCQIIVANSIVCPTINVFWRLNIAFLSALTARGLAVVFGPTPHLFHWDAASLVIMTLVIAMASDFGYYCYHYLMHFVPWMWAFHKVHHSAERLTVFANVRVHPLEIILDAPFRAAGVTLVLGPALYLSGETVQVVTIFGMTLSAALLGTIGAQLHHSHIWLSWGRRLNHLLISPAMHQIHHSQAPRHWNKNLGGSFALWDWIFGTIYVPEGREVLTFGLAEAEPQPHPTLLAAYIVPFLEILPAPAGLVTRFRRLVARPSSARTIS